jgi:hypothetical protein
MTYIKRYKVVPGSVSTHCCFEASVIDTERRDEYGVEHPMCECFHPADAIIIAEALNERLNRILRS